MVVKTPRIQKLLGEQAVRQKQVFSFSVKRAFWPRDGSLRFELIGQPPHWITIDTRTGVISGFAPPTVYDRQHLLTVKAYNEYGEESQHFFLRVVATDVVEDMAHRLQLMLNKKYKNYYRFGAMHPYVHDSLEYIFEYFMNSDNPELFLAKLKENAKKHNIDLGEEISYEDFKKVAKAIDSQIEKKIQTALGDQHIAALAELSNAEFVNLFRQGSQPLGVHAIPVWNYLAAADRHNFSSVSNVLDASAEAIVELRRETAEHNIEEKFEQTVASLHKKP
jgi:hypothetical protein